MKNYNKDSMKNYIVALIINIVLTTTSVVFIYIYILDNISVNIYSTLYTENSTVSNKWYTYNIFFANVIIFSSISFVQSNNIIKYICRKIIEFNEY